MLHSSSNCADLLVGHNSVAHNSEPETVNRDRRVTRLRVNALTRLAELRCRGAKQNVRFLPSLTIHRGEYLARTIRKQNTRRASPDKRIRACSLFAARARSRANVLVRPAKISRIFLLGINPGRNTGQRVRSENSLDKQPSCRPPITVLSPPWR